MKRLDQDRPETTGADDGGGFPRFPRSLSKADRNILAEGAANRFADDAMSKATKAGVNFSPVNEMLFKAFAGLLVQHRWMNQRIEELEGKADGN